MLNLVKSWGIFNVRLYLSNKNKLMVEFYDKRFPFSEYGQLISSYYASSVLDVPMKALTLELWSDVPVWHIPANYMLEIREWIESVTKSDELKKVSWEF